jgi:hypothetical protein
MKHEIKTDMKQETNEVDKDELISNLVRSNHNLNLKLDNQRKLLVECRRVLKSKHVTFNPDIYKRLVNLLKKLK